MNYAPLLGALLALLAWLLPTHPLPWPSFHEEFAMALAGMSVAAGTLWQARRLPATLSFLTIGTLSVAAVPLLQLAGGMVFFRGDAELSTLYLLGFALSQIVGQRIVAVYGIERLLICFASVVLIGAVLSTWLALCQWQDLNYFETALSEMPLGGRPYANLNQPNQLATLLVWGMIATALLFDRRHFGKAPTLLLLAFMGLGMALTQSRAGWLELLVIGALLILVRSRLSEQLQWRNVLVGLAVIAATTGVVKVVNVLTDQTFSRHLAELASGNLRPIHWASLLSAIWQHPWAGYGWSQTVLAQYATAPMFPPTGEILAYSHNLILDLLVWNGIPLGVAIGAALTLWFVGAFRGVSDSRGVLALAFVVAVFTHSMVEFPIAYTYFMLPVGLLMGAIGQITMPAQVCAAPRWIAPALLTCSALATFIVGHDFIGIEADVLALRVERARIGVDRPKHEMSEPLVLTQLAAFAQFGRIREHEGMSDAELEAMRRVAIRFPAADNLLKYAGALALNRRDDEAVEVLRRVCVLNDAGTCAARKQLWLAVGKVRPLVAAVKWPE